MSRLGSSATPLSLDQVVEQALRAHERLGLLPDDEPSDPCTPEERERAAVAKRIADCLPHIAWAKINDPKFVKLCAPKLRSAVTQWKRERGSLVLLGPSGAGKTIAMVALARRLLDETVRSGGRRWAFARRMLFTTGAALSRARIEHGLGIGEAPLVARAIGCSLLLLDELGYLDSGTVVAEIICARDYDNRPAIVTSGLTRDQLDEKYGLATVRKLCERGRVVDLHRGSR